MSPTTKSTICALLLAIIVGWVAAFFWHQPAGSFVGGAAFVVGLVLFGRLFKVPLRSDASH
jgi:uncharacterized membrane protein AbrB (regulator of aidB expression)